MEWRLILGNGVILVLDRLILNPCETIVKDSRKKKS